VFNTLLASNTGTGPWVRPAVAAGVLHFLVILGAVRGTATQPLFTPAPRDTIRLELTPSRPEARPDQPAPTGPVPAIPSLPLQLPAIPPLRLEPSAPLSSPVDLAALTRAMGTETSVEPSAGNGSEKSAFAVDEVDQPPELMRDFHPQYPELLRQSGVGGTVQLEYLIDSTGRVAAASTRVLASTHPAFSTSAIAAVRDARFKPGRRGGHPVAVLARQTIRFVRE
jgi:TonB family protein